MQKAEKYTIETKEDFYRKWFQIMPAALREDFKTDFLHVFYPPIIYHDQWEMDFNDDLG